VHAREAKQHSQERQRQTRARVAQEAARIISEQGIRDYHQAKLKAAARLGVSGEQHLPRNAEIEQALREYQRLFAHDTQPRVLRARREMALEAMRFLHRFEPRLVGAVLEGTADEHSAICLHVYDDDPGAVARYLDEHGIPYEEQTRRLRLDRERHDDFAVLRFSADAVPIDLTIMPRDAQRQAPWDRADDRPMKRATTGALRELLAAEGVVDRVPAASR
jgi:hypothetical protein